MGIHGVMLFGLVGICAVFWYGVNANANANANAIDIDGGVLDGKGWDLGRATFYGPSDARAGMGGACGYTDVFEQGYGQETAALSTALFNNGAACGSCYEIVCVKAPQACKRGVIRVTATNFCPPDYSKSRDIWCNPPQKHFDLAMPMYLKIAEYRAGVVPVAFRRVKCGRRGGIKFAMGGNNYWTLALVFNVGGVGDVKNVRVYSSSSGWIQMSRNWGQNWQATRSLLGNTLSFEVTASDGSVVYQPHVVPSSWRFGMTFQGKSNFR